MKRRKWTNFAKGIQEDVLRFPEQSGRHDPEDDRDLKIHESPEGDLAGNPFRMSLPCDLACKVIAHYH